MTVSLEQLRRCHVAVDLGAARTRVYVKGAGLVVDEPSVAAVNTRTGALIAVGTFAERMTGRTPDYIRVVRPVSGGTVVDIEMAQRMLRHLLGEKLRRALRRKPRLRAAACTPHDADPLAQRAAVETMVGLGARRVELVDTLIAAAVGCGLPVEQPTATMIMVCGAAATQVAVLSLGSIVTAQRIPVGGEAIDHAVVQHLRHAHELMLPSQAVRPLQLALHGNGITDGGPASTLIHGRDVATGLARSVHVDTAAVRDAIHTPLTAVLDGIGKVLRDCPPDLVADLTDRGIMMVGGSALLPGLDQMLRDATGMPVAIAERPDVCAILGLGMMLEGKIAPMVLNPLAE
ncbi:MULTISPECIES: rod shape-determining protein [unclassified Streptomyces]|uniref:rod shape-determining protein n=1 Tax=unclassified Streptomyces TaxID=2593676 RepID=UPI002E160B78|nr:MULTISPECIES: rod shape-determining protein [unclassified Streptomyces]WSR25881.1 rod shape-determining protein [Streptomyces sp. NBC_01205]